jgi:tripartite-type tricarboxylate transporter receptor subunit TctC
MKNLMALAAPLLLAAALAPADGLAAEADYPNKPITLIVPYPPGGNADAFGRIVANGLTSALGQTVVVDNRPGAGSMLGSQMVARAKPDGYTLLLGSIANVLNNYFYKKPLYNVQTELMPVAQLTYVPNYLAVGPNSTLKSVKDIVAYAKASPGKVNCATTGIGTSPYLSCELFKMMTGAPITNVPYKGFAPAVTDVIGGDVTMIFANESLPFIKDKRLNGIAVTTAARNALAPDLPALSESLPGFDVTSWYGVFAPTGTPPELVERLSVAIGKIMATPDSAARCAALGATPKASSPKEFEAYVASEIDKWSKVVKKLDIVLD